jgi:hypothetical protein
MSDSITPTLAILASALKIEHLMDASMQRATDNGLSHLATELPYEFDGSELRIVSQSEAKSGAWVVTDGVSCTCKGGRHAICKHRALFRLLLAREILLDPLYVRTRIIEQVAPAGYFDSDPPPPDDDDRIATFGTRVVALPDVYTNADDWFIG